jgi:flagellar basal-body rod modification protein FlgD
MNPMDNAQMTSQMAQINTVTGIQQLNETVKSLSAQFTSMQVLQGASMVGRGVMLQGNTLSIEAGQAQGAVDLAGNADTVSIQIVSPGGQLVDTVNLGALSAGRHDFTWDASAYQGTGNPSFKVVATQGGSTVSSTSFARDTVTSVGTDNGAMTVQLKGRAAVAYADIAAIL